MNMIVRTRTSVNLKESLEAIGLRERRQPSSRIVRFKNFALRRSVFGFGATTAPNSKLPVRVSGAVRGKSMRVNSSVEDCRRLAGRWADQIEMYRVLVDENVIRTFNADGHAHYVVLVPSLLLLALLLLS